MLSLYHSHSHVYVMYDNKITCLANKLMTNKGWVMIQAWWYLKQPYWYCWVITPWQMILKQTNCLKYRSTCLAFLSSFQISEWTGLCSLHWHSWSLFYKAQLCWLNCHNVQITVISSTSNVIISTSLSTSYYHSDMSMLSWIQMS